MNREHLAFADWDGAYVLGALTPADRRAFEEHLLTCERCRTAVAELAPLPGLLARTAAPEFGSVAGLGSAAGPRAAAGPDGLPRAGSAAEAAPASPSGDLVDLVVRRDARERRAGRVWRGLAAVAAACAVALVVLVALPRGDDAPGPTADPGTTVTLEQVADVPLTASVRLTSVGWGTRIAMDCDYPAGEYGRYGQPEAREYALVVTDSAGTSSQVSTWAAAPGQSVELDAATAVALDEIASVEIRSVETGRSLLSADVG
ncbi:anti-sigma factor family protein [Antribacter gilvus]|uniref:anti-sigma factor family protein n=1 Tax=Antribacter gilvus TaxID=2304675 RepID=UPI000F7B1487|nr:zf-HC2 domain-containing protein [Antribacter gilvus]